MPKITEIYVFVAEVTGPDDEGVVAMKAGDVWLPLVGADRARVDSLRPIAQDMAQASGKPIRLLRFTVREELETLH